MENKLDQLIAKFKEAKEELEKSAPVLHDTVEAFMGGLKTLPKGSAERGKFITQHMNHGPFLSALNQHPQGKQMHTMLMGHLNSKANAGPQAFGGAKVSVGAPPPAVPSLTKSDEDPLEELEKFYISPYTLFGSSRKNKKPEAPAAKPAKPTGIDKIKAVSKEPIKATSIVANDKARGAAQGSAVNPEQPKPVKLTGLDRIKAESQKPIKKSEDEDLEKGKLKDLGQALVPAAISLAAMAPGALKYYDNHHRKDSITDHRSTSNVKPAVHSTSVKKDEDEDAEEKVKKKLEEVKKSWGQMASQMKGTGTNTLTHPSDMSRANAIHAAMPNTYQPTKPAKKLTGLDRIKAAAAQPIAKDEFHKLPEGGYGKVSGRLITQPVPKLKPAAMGLHHVGHDSKENTPNQLEDTAVREPTVNLHNKKFTKTINTSGAPDANMAMSEKLSLNKGGQWSLGKAEELHDEKGRCLNCGNKACDGKDCTVDHEKAAVEANNAKNKEFSNKIKIAKDEEGC